MNELQSLSQIFQNRLFRIPDYQRGYAWQDPQLRDFWEDIINLQADRYHYTGLLSLKVLNAEESRKLGRDDAWLLQSGFRGYHVVDGQQRLTTFVIMLHELIEFVRNLPENADKSDMEIYIGFESIQDITAKYICRKRPPDGVIVTYMFGYENDNPSAEYLKHRIFGQPFGGTIGETYYTKNLQNAKEFFIAQIKVFYDVKGMAGIEELYRKITLHLRFNIHEIEDDYDVFVAFETMNNRGKRLSNLERLKNRLIYLTTLYPKNILDEPNARALRELINKTWREVYYQLGRNENDLLSDDAFLRDHWIMYYTYSSKIDYIQFLLRKFSHKSIFENVLAVPPQNEDTFDRDDEDEDDDDMPYIPETVSGTFLQPGEIMDYVNSLGEAAAPWYYTYHPDECTYLSDEEQVWLEKLGRIGLGYFRPIVAVSLIERLDYEEAQHLDFFKAVEKFIFVNFRFGAFRTNYRNSEYYRKARELYAGNITLPQVTAGLHATTDGNVPDAVRGFQTTINRRFEWGEGFYSWAALRYFLYEYEYSLAAQYHIEKLSWANLNNTVQDRVTVEHILPRTPTKLYWRNHFRQFTDWEIQTLSGSLGNLLPLSQSINAKLQNNSFEEKRALYKNGCHSEVEVAKEETWDAQHIYDRGMGLLHFMAPRWGIWFESPAQMDELLHISFVHDGRAIPPEITNEQLIEEKAAAYEENGDRMDHVSAVLLRFAGKKDALGEIHVALESCNRAYVRFTTDAVDKILPDSPDFTSGWGTKNHYFYEIVRRSWGSVTMQLALSGEHIPPELEKICEKMLARLGQSLRDAWVWCTPFSTDSAEIPWDMPDEEILRILENQYAQLREFEKRLTLVMREK